MIRCEGCSTENTDDSFYCKHCGTSLTRTPTDEVSTTLDLPVGRVPRGTVVGGDGGYRVEQLLGEGGMGVVYRATSVETATPVAVKFLRPTERGSGTARQRFQREIEVARRLDHPHLVRVLDSGAWEATSYLVMEFVDGASLREKIQRRETFGLEAMLPPLRQLCDAIQAIHDAGVVHRDVKPSNVLLTPSGEVKVCDFGLAFTEGVELTRITRTGTSIGTPEYMAPEQIEGRRVDSRADIYSLGVLMYEAFTGELPFAGESAMAIIMQHLNRAPPPPSALNAALPAWLERTILRAMEKEPSRRFQSMGEIRQRLTPSASGRRTERHPLTGDLIVLDDRDAAAPLRIHCQSERTDWTESMALRFNERFYKLVGRAVSGTSTHPFTYTFERWPDTEVLRRVIDYEDSAIPEPKTKWEGLKKLFRKG